MTRETHDMTVTRMRSLLTLLVLAALLAGCNSAPKRDLKYAPVEPVAIPQPVQSGGAIYQAGNATAWFEDLRARRVGDILVVRLVEETAAEHSNEGEVKRDNTSTITNPTLLGNPLSFGLPTKSKSYDANLGFSLSSSADFKGEAENTQSNELSGSLTVMVTEVLPNGYMKVRGEKRLGMSGGNEYIRVSGIVRPADIDTNNEIDSTRIADATLVYVGDGQVGTVSTMGWLAKFFISSLMPF